jgi:hypothetical protein
MTVPREPNAETVAEPAAPEVGEPVAPVRTEAVHEDRVVERRGWYPTFGPGLLVGALGALGVVISLFMEWTANGTHPNAIPVAFLGDDATSSTSPSLLIVLIPAALLLIIGAVVPMGAALRFVGAIGTLVVVGLFAFQLSEAIDGGDLGGTLGTGWYVATVGAFLSLASGLVPETWTRRSEVVHSETTS